MASTIPAALAKAAQRWPDKVAIIDGEQQITFSQLLAWSRHCAKALITASIEQGDRIAVWAPNMSEWIVVAIGTQMVGAIVVPLNTRYKGLEVQQILNASSSRILFTVSGFLDVDYPQLLAGLELNSIEQTILMRTDSASDHDLDLTGFIDSGKSVSDKVLNQRIAQVEDSTIADILYTSGTTGKPKGVMSSHGQVVRTFNAWADAVNLSAKDTYLIVNPFFHTFGYKAGWLTGLLKGATIIPQAVFDVDAIVNKIQRYSVTMLPGAPTIFQSLLQYEYLADYNLTSLRCAVTGAASVPEQLVIDMKQILGFDEVYTGYGLTECGVVSICCKDDDFSIIANTAGKALAGTEIKVVDDNDQPVVSGDIGLIKVRGFNVMLGYFNNEQATSAAINRDGWLDTGDLGWIDQQGYIKITGRAKDMYISGGFNCYPAEIENLLLNHPDIVDVAVCGVADGRMGEVGHAYVVYSNNDEFNETALSSWAKQKMANFKVPRYFTLVESLPRNTSGKVQKFLLD